MNNMKSEIKKAIKDLNNNLANNCESVTKIL